MMYLQKFSKIKSLQDIKLEKARLRYEMLVAENRLMENINAIERSFSISSFFSKFTYGFRTAVSVYEKIQKIAGKFSFGRKKKKDNPSDSEPS